MVNGLYVTYHCVWFVCGTMVNGLYVIYYCVWFVCGTMYVNQQSHLYTPVYYCTHLYTAVPAVHVLLYTPVPVPVRTCILYKCHKCRATTGHLWSAHVSVLRGRPVCTSGEPGFGKLPKPTALSFPSRPHSARGQARAHLHPRARYTYRPL